jgi:hypothetical protein
MISVRRIDRPLTAGLEPPFEGDDAGEDDYIPRVAGSVISVVGRVAAVVVVVFERILVFMGSSAVIRRIFQ